ncbi:tail fiber domain-containing protein, partial [Candidatus Woesebacteria bacterium]|nr:tail fiber domain-containing protein [Candidatus Woesebacteria bacterium]
NVGIGTTAPSSKLAVTGTAEMGGNYGWLSSSFGARISPPGTSVSAAASATTGALALYAGSGEYGIHADGASSKNYFAGNVGIGTTTIPSQLYIRSAVETRAMAFTSSTTDYSEFAAQNSASTGIMMRMYGTATTGTWAGVNVAGASALFSQANGLFIGHPSTTNIPIIFGKSDAEYMRITTNGNVSIGTTATTRKLTVAGTARITTSQAVTDTLTLCTDANGDIEFKSGACSTSSIKYKQNVENLSYGLDSIREMNPVFFEYKDWVGNDLSSRTKRKVGFIAEEMELIIPEVVIKENGEIDGIDYAFLTSVLANGIKQLDTRVESIFINFVASTASITDLTVQSLQIGGRTIEDYIVSIINNQSTGNSNELVSPLAGELIADSLVTNTLNTENLTATGSSTLGNLLVADISITNDVSVGGELTAESLLVNADASVSGSLLAGLVNADALTTQNATVSGTLEAGTLIANHIDATSTRISALEAGIAQLEHVRATTADIVNATVSGTLYADNIYDFENKVATTLQRPGLLDILLGTDESTTSATFMQDLYDIVNTTEFNASTSADLNLSFSELSMTNDDVALTGTALFIEKYLKVNGSGYISDSLAVGNKLFIGETMQIADGLIRYTTTDPTNQILQIQPEGQGSVELLAGIVIIDDSGKVAVNGDLEVTGSAKVASLLTNMLKPADFGNPLQVQVAGVDTQTNEVKKSRFEIINEVGTPVATFSAEGNAEFAGKAEFGGGIGVTSQVLGSSESNELTTDKTSGKATIKSGASDVTIKSNLITNESLVYVTAVGSTGNQVIYVKAQTADDTNTPEQEGKFVVGFDNLTSTDVSFNWWIVN